MVLLLLAVQVVYSLYATSALTAAGSDAVHRVASADIDHGDVAAVDEAQRRATEELLDSLGRYGRDRVRVSWIDDPDSVVLSLRGDNPSFLPRGLRRPLGLDHIERTMRARIERPLHL